jgi:hypothetical protein
MRPLQREFYLYRWAVTFFSLSAPVPVHLFSPTSKRALLSHNGGPNVPGLCFCAFLA